MNEESKRLMNEVNTEIDALLGVRRQLEQAILNAAAFQATREQEVALDRFESQVMLVVARTKKFSKAMRKQLAARSN